jgi:hypothetical protein
MPAKSTLIAAALVENAAARSEDDDGDSMATEAAALPSFISPPSTIKFQVE